MRTDPIKSYISLNIESYDMDLGRVHLPLIRWRSKGNDCSKTLLTNAAWNGEFESVHNLLKQKADPNQTNDKGWTPLMFASKRGFKYVVETLIEYDADVNQSGPDGLTPSILAASNGNLEALRCLVDNGADFNKPNKIGYTPLDFAKKNKHYKIVEYLERMLYKAESTHENMFEAENAHFVDVIAETQKSVPKEFVIGHLIKNNSTLNDQVELLSKENGLLKARVRELESQVYGILEEFLEKSKMEDVEGENAQMFVSMCMA